MLLNVVGWPVGGALCDPVGLNEGRAASCCSRRLIAPLLARLRLLHAVGLLLLALDLLTQLLLLLQGLDDRVEVERVSVEVLAEQAEVRAHRRA